MHVNMKIITVALCFAAVATAQAQQPVPSLPSTPAPNGNGAKPPAGVTIPAGVTAPGDYLIGPDDILAVVFWREKDMSIEVTVRPDGKISLPLLNDVQASGLTPEQLRVQLTEAASKFIEEPTVTVVVKQINSRKVFLMGQVNKPGTYPLSGPTTLLQLLATAGGLQEYADSKNIVVMRTENGRPVSYRFNYREVIKRRNLKQNIELRPGDTIIVP